jgi:hypothetical protein
MVTGLVLIPAVRRRRVAAARVPTVSASVVTVAIRGFISIIAVRLCIAYVRVSAESPRVIMTIRGCVLAVWIRSRVPRPWICSGRRLIRFAAAARRRKWILRIRRCVSRHRSAHRDDAARSLRGEGYRRFADGARRCRGRQPSTAPPDNGVQACCAEVRWDRDDSVGRRGGGGSGTDHPDRGARGLRAEAHWDCRDKVHHSDDRGPDTADRDNPARSRRREVGQRILGIAPRRRTSQPCRVHLGNEAHSVRAEVCPDMPYSVRRRIAPQPCTVCPDHAAQSLPLEARRDSPNRAGRRNGWEAGTARRDVWLQPLPAELCWNSPNRAGRRNEWEAGTAHRDIGARNLPVEVRWNSSNRVGCHSDSAVDKTCWKPTLSAGNRILLPRVTRPTACFYLRPQQASSAFQAVPTDYLFPDTCAKDRSGNDLPSPDRTDAIHKCLGTTEPYRARAATGLNPNRTGKSAGPIPHPPMPTPHQSAEAGHIR